LDRTLYGSISGSKWFSHTAGRRLPNGTEWRRAILAGGNDRFFVWDHGLGQPARELNRVVTACRGRASGHSRPKTWRLPTLGASAKPQSLLRRLRTKKFRPRENSPFCVSFGVAFRRAWCPRDGLFSAQNGLKMHSDMRWPLGVTVRDAPGIQGPRRKTHQYPRAAGLCGLLFL